MNALTLLFGGARSGKSELAVRLARAQPGPVVVIATAQAGDEEMAARIAQHRRERAPEWETIEAPLELRDALARAPDDACVIIDCLTLWTSNMLAARGATETEAQAGPMATTAATRRGPTIVVSNEVGLGIVPDNPLAREYRDLLGRVNAIWAAAADHAYLLVAGRALALEPATTLVEELAQ